jgi:hypothetical protein
VKNRYVLEIDKDNGIDCIDIETTPDNEPRFWLLYKPETRLNPNDHNIYLWIRRADYVYLNEMDAKEALQKLINRNVVWFNHELFPELQIGIDDKGFNWLLEPVPLRIRGNNGF